MYREAAYLGTQGGIYQGGVYLQVHREAYTWPNSETGEKEAPGGMPNSETGEREAHGRYAQQ